MERISNLVSKHTSYFTKYKYGQLIHKEPKIKSLNFKPHSFMKLAQASDIETMVFL